MSYSRRQLEAFGEPLGESATRLKEGGFGRIYGGGGGGGGQSPVQQQTQISDLPDWAKGYAQDVLAKVNGEMVKAVKEPAFGEQLKGLGIEIIGSSRAELDAFRADQTKRIAELVKAAGVSLQ